MLHDILTEAQQTLLELLSRIPEVRTYYLAGGTALALHLGHRRSRDFDFFRAKEFVPHELLSVLRGATEVDVLQEGAGTLTAKLDGIPVSFFHYDYPLLCPLHESPWGLLLADPEDVAAMKLSALAGRGSRKDFVDLYVYAKQIAPLERLLERFHKKYRGVNIDPYHLLRSLTFFDDAEAEPMPDMLKATSWEEMKSFFRAEGARLFHRL